MKSSDKGFSLVEGLLLILTVTAIVFVGYTITQKDSDKSSPDVDESSDSQNAESTVSDVSDVADSEPSTLDTYITPDGYVRYVSQSTGIVYSLPQEWGAPEERQRARIVELEAYEGNFGWGAPYKIKRLSEGEWVVLDGHTNELRDIYEGKDVFDSYFGEVKRELQGYRIYDQFGGEGDGIGTSVWMIKDDKAIVFDLEVVYYDHDVSGDTWTKDYQEITEVVIDSIEFL